MRQLSEFMSQTDEMYLLARYVSYRQYYINAMYDQIAVKRNLQMSNVSLRLYSLLTTRISAYRGF